MVIDGRTPDPAITWPLEVLIVVAGTLLARGARRLGRPAAGWLRPALWQR